MYCGGRPGLDVLDPSPPMRLDANPCREDHELSQRLVAKVDGSDRDPITSDAPRKRLPLRDLCASLSARLRQERLAGDSAREEEDEAGGPSSNLVMVVK